MFLNLCYISQHALIQHGFVSLMTTNSTTSKEIQGFIHGIHCMQQIENTNVIVMNLIYLQMRMVTHRFYTD